jgi:photosystem II stability/assembly factor-like uncharacterized protein
MNGGTLVVRSARIVPHRVAGLAGLAVLALAGARAPAQAIDERLLADVAVRAIGPAATGGRIVDVAVPAQAPWRIYAASASGGVWRSDNNGTTWSCIFDRALSIGALALFAGDPDVLWVGTGEANNQRSSYAGNGVWRTLDGGKSWDHLGLEATQHVARIVTDPSGRDRDLAWVAAMGHLYTRNPERGLYRSDDGGKSWELVLQAGDGAGVTDVAADPRGGGVLYAATYERMRRAWTYEDVGDAAIYKSTDGGDSWRRLSGGLPRGKLGRIGVAVARSAPDVVYACIDNQNPRPAEAKPADGAASDDAKGGPPRGRARGGANEGGPIGGEVWRSTDGGLHWSRQNDKPVSGQPPYYYGRIQVDPNRAERVWLLGIQVFVSSDAGKSWSEGEVASSLHSDHHALFIDPDRAGRVILGNDGGLAQSYDDGRTWDWYNNLPVSQFYTVSVDERRPYHVYGGLQDCGVWTGPSRGRGPGGATAREWNFIGGGDGMYVLTDPKEPNVVYLESQFGALSRTDVASGESAFIAPQAGAKEVKLRWNWCAPILLSAHNSRILYFGAQFLWKSLDRGDHWKKVSPDLTSNDEERQKGNVPHCTITTISESPLDADLLLVGTDDGNVQWTKDGGATWTELSGRMPGLPPRRWVSRVELSRHDVKTAWVAFTGYREDDFAPRVYRTRDGGETFEAVTTGLPDGPVNVVHESPRAKEVLFLGSDAGAFFSIDGGDHWQRLATGLPVVSVLDLAVHPREREVVLATHGRGLFVVDVTAHEQMTDAQLDADAWLFAPDEAVDWRSLFSLGDVFGGDRRWRAPNPESGAPIWYWLGEAAEPAPKLEILADGKVVRTLELKNEPGLHRVVWDLRPEPPRAAAPADADAKEKEAPKGDAKRPSRRYDDSTTPGEPAEDEELELAPFAQDAGGRRRGGRGAAPLPPGRYLVRLRAGETTTERPLVIRPDPIGTVPIGAGDGR